jgi:DNA polymerase III sliding clamp (beta) subunit (PCNA family)
MNEIEISGRVLLELVTGAGVGAARDTAKESRPHLTGVHLSVKSGSVRAAGTNGIKLAVGTYDMPTNSPDFELLLTPSGVKLLTTWLKNWVKEYGRKGINPIPVTLSDSSVNYCGNVLNLDVFSVSSFPNLDSVIPSNFTPPTDSPAQGFMGSILADVAKIPNSDKQGQINLRIAYDMRPSMASWVNDSGVAWRYVMMPRPIDKIQDIA